MSQSAETWIQFKCLEVTQPIGVFYVGVMASADLVKLSISDVRRIDSEPREVESYLGIERPLDRRRRVPELKEYVGTVDATFPSAIILAVEHEDTQEYDPERGILRLRNSEHVAKVLDGQHRIAGLEDYPDKNFECIATIFVDMDIENQAMVFATINLEQTRVNRSLTYDLFEYAKQRSPQKTLHNIVRLLDARKDTPFQGKIKILGTAGDPGETISQALFIDAMMPYVSVNARRDRDTLKRGGTLARATEAEEFQLIFRNMFIDGEDAKIARVLWNYFGAVEDKWGSYWRDVRRGYVLNRTTGFRGLMLFLRPAYLHLIKPGEVPDREQFLKEIFTRVRIRGEDFTPDNFPPGSSGQTRLRDMLLSQTSLG